MSARRNRRLMTRDVLSRRRGRRSLLRRGRRGLLLRRKRSRNGSPSNWGCFKWILPLGLRPKHSCRPVSALLLAWDFSRSRNMCAASKRWRRRRCRSYGRTGNRRMTHKRRGNAAVRSRSCENIFCLRGLSWPSSRCAGRRRSIVIASLSCRIGCRNIAEETRRMD